MSETSIPSGNYSVTECHAIGQGMSAPADMGAGAEKYVHQAAIVHAYEVKLQVTVWMGDLGPGRVGDSHLESRVVRVHRDMSLAEINCTKMHEMAHIALGHVFSDDEAEYLLQEEEADEWAATKLISDDMLEMASITGRDVRSMAETCGVDERTMRARLKIRDAQDHIDHVLTGVVEADQLRLRIA